jgi:hypothetical protein
VSDSDRVGIALISLCSFRFYSAPLREIHYHSTVFHAKTRSKTEGDKNYAESFAIDSLRCFCSEGFSVGILKSAGVLIAFNLSGCVKTDAQTTGTL